jgi:hypothetical protein
MTHESDLSKPLRPEGMLELFTIERLEDETIALLSAHYDIEVYVGDHGHSSSYMSERGMGHLQPNFAPSDLDYADIADIIDSVRSGDRLYMEGPGHARQSPKPEAVEQAEAFISSKHDSSVAIAASGILKTQLQVYSDNMLRAAEQGRETATITTFTYAEYLALGRNIPVLYADINAVERDVLEVAAGKRLDLLDQFDTGEKAIFNYVSTQRERAAGQRLVDDALEHLPEPTSDMVEHESTTTKKRLILLMGTDHRDGLEQVFADLGLENVSINSLKK